MSRFFARRILEVIPVIFGITVVCFALLHLIPGDPARTQLGPRAPQSAVDELRHTYGLDQSVVTQYLHFLKDAASLSFGKSFQTQQPVSGIIGPRVLPSVFLILYGLLLAVLIAFPLATLSAVKRDHWQDHAIRVFTTAAFAMPAFWLGLLLSLIFGLQLGWFPTSGYGDTTWEHFKGLTLPAVTLGLFLAVPLLRSLRTTLIDNLSAEFTEAVRARGLSAPRVVLKHVMRNSLTSTITLLGLFVAVLLSATVVVENVFSIPGLGSLLVASVATRDYPVVQSITLLFGVTTVIVSLLTDVLYAVVDPRVRL